ncbi:Hypothetical protein, putative [Bodo saltans]|uniref:COMM domain-containing protein n=1 Tax=Bodo saltans TaxID=75058 RepID=A0A0S4JQ97_BODSA|nr:Hypothetical protein, putative [Bodo saltans]|eukprot:CUG90674.1 Hypothetical protein, putative [Bodo saltans]
MTVLPQTETFRQALEHLHGYTEASPADVVAIVLEASSTTATSMSVVHQTVAFIVSQLCFVAPQDAESIERLLSAEVATSFGATQTLSKEWRDALTSAWLAGGKSLVQAARERTVERYCYGGQQTTNPRFLSVEAAVVTSSGSVLENISAATNEPSDVSVDYTYEVNRHVPVATVQFPPTSAHLHRTPVVLESEGMYKLFLELDNIQKAVDVVKGAAS